MHLLSTIYIEMAAEAEAYFKAQGIRELFSKLLEGLATAKPENPKAYLASQLSPADHLDADTYRLLLQAFQRISCQLSPDQAATTIIEETCSFLNCERATLFIHNPQTHTLVSLLGKGVKGLIRPETGGLTGAMFESSTVITISDAYEDPRFNQEVDQQTGYRTQSIIGSQIRDSDKKPIGVLMAINKREGGFTARDEELISLLADQAGITYQNAWIHEISFANERRVSGLVNVIRAVQKDLPAQSFAYGLSHNVRDLIGAHGCSVFLVDTAQERLVSLASDSLRIVKQPLTQSIAGNVVLSGQPVKLDRATVDARYNAQVDQKSSFTTESLCAVPIFDLERKVVGVIEAYNKRLSAQFGDLQDYGSFDDSDVELLDLLGALIGRKLVETTHYLLNREKQQEPNEPASNFKAEFGRPKKHSLPSDAIPEESAES